jgi:hydrogenase maturation protease
MGASISAKTNLLVLGIGNTLRCDDGAGVAVSEAMASQAPCLNVKVGPQLSPELSAEISQARAVLFIDAFMTEQSGTQRPILQPLRSGSAETAPAGDPFSHALTPERLLALTLALYNHCPPAWQLLIPGHQWDVGDELSPATRQACQEALPLALEWVAAHA